MPKFNDLTGQCFGRLTVLSFAGIHKTRTAWNCVCQCGTEKVVLGRALRTGHTQSCGCLLRDSRVQIGNKTYFTNFKNSFKYNRKAPGLSCENKWLNKYKNSAKQRKILWSLSNDDFFNLVQQNCSYCGDGPNILVKPDSVRPDWVEKASIKVNGIDRVNNALGYVKENCVPCCSFCNYAKRDRSAEEFEMWLDRLVTYRKD